MADKTEAHIQRDVLSSEIPQRYTPMRSALPAAVLAAAMLVGGVLTPSSVTALDVQSPGLDWTEAYHKDNLVIFTKDIGRAHEILAVSELDVPPAVVFGVLRDFEHYPEFMPYVRESRVLSRANDLEMITYARLAPPFVSERDYALHVTMTRGSPSNGGIFKLEWMSVPEAHAEIDRVVRIKINEGAWMAEPLASGKQTRLTYRVLTDPGGLIPSFVVDLSNTVSIPELFEAVKKRAEKVAGQN